jgi:hypothetical protein
MKKELLKKLKYDMPQDEAPEMEISLGMEEEEEGEEPEMISLDMEGEESSAPDLSGFSDEELQAELDKRKKPEMPEEEMA